MTKMQSGAELAPISIADPLRAATDILTRRQHDVLTLMVRGLSNKEIACALNLAEGAVTIHVAALFSRLGSLRKCESREVPMTQPRSEPNVCSAVEAAPQMCDVVETLALPRDASLLSRCMDMLRVDRSDLEREDPLLFRELESLCALCRSKEECAQDLADVFDDAGSNKWWAYCPNLATLRALWRFEIIERVERQIL